ncbi:uncharacterized protein [Nicotiana sylvestris]|uniref:uncharacterized protein isoform X2 n=1 Tax=Nicotiana sylvestris TaxID=4096 RepID=UPI00388CB516
MSLIRNKDNLERDWTYKRLDGRGGINSSFITSVNKFLQFACSQRNRMSGDNVRCPCKKCHNIKYMDVETVKLHLYQYGFVENYFLWKYQGEKDVTGEMSSSGDLDSGAQPESGYENPYRQMVLDAAGPNFGHGLSWQSYNNTEPESSYSYEPSMEADPNPSMEAEPNPSMDEEPNPSMEEDPNLECQRFYDLLQAADTKLYPGSSLSQLAVVSKMLNIKMENTLSQRGYNQMMHLLKEALPEDNTMLDNYYKTKKLVRSLGLPVEKIDCCNSGCMLYWGEDEDLTSCKFCGHQRYKRRVGSRKLRLIPYKKMYYFPLIPRLRRLYASQATAADMRCHHEHIQEEGVMRHPSHSEAWKHFNETHPFFAVEPRNVRKNIKRYYNNKHKLNLILIIVKHIIKPREEKRKEEYMVLDLKQNATTGQILMALLDLMLHRQQHLHMLNQHRQGIWMS